MVGVDSWDTFLRFRVGRGGIGGGREEKIGDLGSGFITVEDSLLVRVGRGGIGVGAGAGSGPGVG